MLPPVRFWPGTLTWRYYSSFNKTWVNSFVNLRDRPDPHSRSGQLESAVYVYRRANNYVTTAVASVKINLPALLQTASSFKAVASVEKKKNFHAALWVNAQLQGECFSPLLTVASSRAQCELQSSHKGPTFVPLVSRLGLVLAGWAPLSPLQ